MRKTFLNKIKDILNKEISAEDYKKYKIDYSVSNIGGKVYLNISKKRGNKQIRKTIEL